MFPEFSNTLLLQLTLLSSLIVVLLWRRWGEWLVVWLNDESDANRPILYSVQVERLDIPFSVKLSSNSKELSVISQAVDWHVYTYGNIPIATVLSDILKQCSNDEEYERLLREVNHGNHCVTEHSSAGSENIPLETDESDVTTSEQRLVYPLVVAATDHKSLYTSGGSSEQGECSVCLTMSAACFLLPCRHKCACQSCTLRLNYCPVCRAHIASYVNTEEANS